MPVRQNHHQVGQYQARGLPGNEGSGLECQEVEEAESADNLDESR